MLNHFFRRIALLILKKTTEMPISSTSSKIFTSMSSSTINEGVNATGIASKGSIVAMTLSGRTFIDVMGAPYNAQGDGKTDDTPAIHAAAIAASISGCRYLWFRDGRQFSAPTLDDDICRDAIFLGSGSKLVNIPVLSRKHLIPIGAGGPVVPTGDYIPAAHTPLGSKRAVTVMFIGDSHTTWDAQDIYTAPGLVRKLAEKFQNENPTTAYTFLNYGIGGTNLANLTMLNADGTSSWTPSYYPDWWTDHTQSWLQMAQIAAPDIMVWVRCTNEVSLSSALLINRSEAVLEICNTWAKPPGHVLCIEPTRSLRHHQAPNVEEGVHGVLRSFARFFKLGVLDMARMSCMAREGFDPLREMAFLSATANENSHKTLPYTFPGVTRSYGLAVITWGIPGDNAFAEAGGEFQFTTSSVAGNIFRVGIDFVTNCWYYQSDVPSVEGGSTSSIPRTITNIPGVLPDSGKQNFIFQLYGSRVVAQLWDASLSSSNITIFDGNIIKVGGLFVPTVSCTNTGAEFLVGSLSMSTPVLNVPTLTDTEAYGLEAGAGPAGTDYYGGDGGIHVGAGMIAQIYMPLLNATSFATGGNGIGATHSAGIVGLDDYVTVQGQSGSKALIMHAAPGVQQWGYLDNGLSTHGIDFFAAGNHKDINMTFHAQGAGRISLASPVSMPAIVNGTSYANDAAAAAGGVPVNGLYLNGSVLQVRIS